MSELRPRSNRSATVAGIARHGQLKKSGPWATILKIVGAALVVVLVSGASVAAIVVNQISDQVTTVTLVGETEGPPPSIGAYEGGFNILIVGSDQCEKEGGCEDRTATLNDVTMLLHVSEDQTNAVAVSFPRDLVVPIPSCPREDGSGNNSAMSARPINETLYYGGLPCTVLTVEALTGLDIQFAGLITFNGVIKMGDAVGGVPVCVNGPIDDKYTGLKIDAAGTYTMSGQDALNFLRTRHGVGDGSDLTRISSQQVYLSSLVRTLKSSETLGDPLKLYNLAQAATQSMTLSQNFSSLDTLVSIGLALKDIPLASVTFVQYPGTTGVGGVYTGKVAPVTAKADELFALIAADTPFALANVGDDRGSEVDPNAPVEVVDPTATADPAVDPLAVLDITGQTAADYTCSVANN
ncbi:LCP family protein required for cell wall assembly [Conyzicola lurida]|uniref:LCP family protein required for cell wall assembly n=1 Tax=Conyzicola lurida TaxID=1172621 RepID=A0A841AR14_9MICO|nr:LCP family protein [Conyzicola lurida]MBB5844724.1 LCP family protein required for cell wall assembly [Conyzicola lurida]